MGIYQGNTRLAKVGADGKTAYAAAVEKGFNGTEEDFGIILANAITGYGIRQLVALTGAEFDALKEKAPDTAYYITDDDVFRFATEDDLDKLFTDANFKDGVLTLVYKDSTSKPLTITSVPTYHISADPNKYGVGTLSEYGHLRITDDARMEYTATTGIAITPKGVIDQVNKLQKNIDSTKEELKKYVDDQIQATINSSWEREY